MGSIFGSPQSGKPNSSSANQVVATNSTTATAASTGCGLGINGFSSSESVTVGPMSQHPTISKLEQQVAELEQKVLKERELLMMYEKRLERTQDYLRYCLQVAQDNGFLNLIHNYRDAGPQPSPPSSNVVTPNASPQFPTIHLHHSSDLAAVIDQAQLNGWYIHPEEIAMEVVEDNLRPKLADDHDGQLGELIDLICLSWDADASVRPSFSTITSSLKALQNKIFD